MTAGLTFFMIGLTGAAYRIARAERDAAIVSSDPAPLAEAVTGFTPARRAPDV